MCPYTCIVSNFNTDPSARGGERSNGFISRGGKVDRGRPFFDLGAPPPKAGARADAHPCVKRSRGVSGV
jgi:hypothetical protein